MGAFTTTSSSNAQKSNFCRCKKKKLNRINDSPNDAQKPAAKRGRKPLPSHLERRRVEHDKACRCGCQKTRIGEDISEKLNVIPAQVFVEQHVRAKYACPACEGDVIIAKPEPT
ncbi:IS66 family transposase zinc-finger binding domain-containing protein [Reinekea forsetii]|nr:IS66 family transposase zinc-finger binding domain-containing protein [Reinekea forsetii]